MALTAGEQLGPYEILSLLGKGGMGEVYRARDPRVGRDVAIKVSAKEFEERFAREARTIASLNHPNICHLYDVGPNFLVMELVEGPTLAERIKQGPIPLEETLAIARQIADALEAAHEKGIVHRDLKPGNIKVKVDGTVKVLDFGLAKVGGAPTAQSEDSPTISMAATQAGMILGTLAYMSPEQARGNTVDRRADIWAFGVVVSEMLTGRRLFQGDSVSDVLASVIKDEPDLTRVPSEVRLMLKRCLEKDPKKRLRDIADALPLVGAAAESAPPSSKTAPARSRLGMGLAIAGGLMAVALAAVAFLYFREKAPAPVEALRFQIGLPENVNLTSNRSFSISPDGRKIVFVAQGADGVMRLWLRALDSLEAKPLPGTELPNAPAPPFWSPDSRFIAFDAGGKLKKIEAAGGPPQTICDNLQGLIAGGSWNRDNVIIFPTGGTRVMMRVPAAGGVPAAVTALDSSRRDVLHAFATFLPDSRHFLYLRLSAVPENSGVFVGSLDSRPAEQSSKRVLATALAPGYDPSTGRMVFVRDGTLLAQKFDTGAMELTGEPVPVAEPVGTFNLAGLFSVSENGVLVYSGGGVGGSLQLTWFDRQGKVIGPAGEPGPYLSFNLSPDGTKAAVRRLGLRAGALVDLWVEDLTQSRSTRLTSPIGAGSVRATTDAIFSPDGNRIVFGDFLENALYQKAANGAGGEEVLLKPLQGGPMDWSRDGRFLIYGSAILNSQSDLGVLPLTGDRKPFPYLRSPFNKVGARLSPDGHWIAYRTNESGRDQIVVQAFSPTPDFGATTAAGKWTVSNSGALGMVRWRADGKELFYLASDGKVMAVEVTTNPVFRAGAPVALFQAPRGVSAGTANAAGLADVAADGKRFIFAVPVAQAGREELTVVQNWQSVLKK